MTRLLAALFAVTVTIAVGALAREQPSKSLYVVVSDGTEVRGGFQPDDQPVDVPNATARLRVALMQKDVRLADGQIITGFSFDGWTEGEGVRIVVSALVPADGTNRYVEVKRGMRPSFGKREFARFALTPGEKRSIDEMKAFQAGQSETGTFPPAAEAHCVSFETPSRVLAGESFTTPIGKGLEFRLRAERAGIWIWNITVGPTATRLDYLWVVSPPFQTAPHRQIGPGYNLSAPQSAQLSPRRFRFVTTPQEYDDAVALVERAGRDPAAAVTFRDFEKKAPGTLELWITGSGLSDADDAPTWVTLRGNACQPR
jgi:hypothetical protein